MLMGVCVQMWYWCAVVLGASPHSFYLCCICRPWQGAIIPAAHNYFRKVLQDCEEKYGWKGMAEAIMGPAFRHRYAESNARSAKLFNFLNEALSQPVPNSPATFVVNAESLKEMSVRGIEPQLHIKNIQDGNYRPFKVSEIVGLNQWIYDPTLLYETTVSVTPFFIITHHISVFYFYICYVYSAAWARCPSVLCTRHLNINEYMNEYMY